MKQVGRPGRRTWIYIAPNVSCAVWSWHPQRGRQPATWLIERGVSAFDMNCYRRLPSVGARARRPKCELPLEDGRARALEPLMKGELVYAFYGKDCRAVKIGRTGNLRRRWAVLENSAGNLRQLICVWRCRDSAASRELERELHDRWIEHRVFGEWFAADPVVADLQQEWMTAPRQPNAVLRASAC